MNFASFMNTEYGGEQSATVNSVIKSEEREREREREMQSAKGIIGFRLGMSETWRRGPESP